MFLKYTINNLKKHSIAYRVEYRVVSDWFSEHTELFLIVTINIAPRIQEFEFGCCVSDYIIL